MRGLFIIFDCQIVYPVLFKLGEVFVNAVVELVHVVRVGVFKAHVAPGQLLGQNVVEYGVLIIGDGLVYAAFFKGFGGERVAVPGGVQFFHAMLGAVTEEFLLNVVVIGKRSSPLVELSTQLPI